MIRPVPRPPINPDWHDAVPEEEIALDFVPAFKSRRAVPPAAPVAVAAKGFAWPGRLVWLGLGAAIGALVGRMLA